LCRNSYYLIFTFFSHHLKEQFSKNQLSAIFASDNPAHSSRQAGGRQAGTESESVVVKWTFPGSLWNAGAFPFVERRRRREEERKLD
jgi:hypothetical protein